MLNRPVFVIFKLFIASICALLFLRLLEFINKSFAKILFLLFILFIFRFIEPRLFSSFSSIPLEIILLLIKLFEII